MSGETLSADQRAAVANEQVAILATRHLALTEEVLIAHDLYDRDQRIDLRRRLWHSGNALALALEQRAEALLAGSREGAPR